MPLPEGQHEWEATFAADDLGRPLPPRHQVLIFADVIGAPGPEAREHLERALSSLEDRHPYGVDGLLTAVGWGGSWFNQHTEHRGLVNAPARMSRWEDPLLDAYDAVFHLASNRPEILEDARETLFGNSPWNQSDFLTMREVRTGFIGAGLPKQALPHLPIPEDAPLLLGFRSALKDNQATEQNVTIVSGPLAGGTTAHVSRIELAVEEWYAKSRDERAALLYAPTVSAAQADALVDDAPSDYTNLEKTVAQYGIIGHAQAAARARVDNKPLINRRDFATVDDGKPGTHFISIQRELRDFNNTRATMNGADGVDHHASVGSRHRNGINAFFNVTRRATFAIPPRALRAYPLSRTAKPAMAATAPAGNRPGRSAMAARAGIATRAGARQLADRLDGDVLTALAELSDPRALPTVTNETERLREALLYIQRRRIGAVAGHELADVADLLAGLASIEPALAAILREHVELAHHLRAVSESEPASGFRAEGARAQLGDIQRGFLFTVGDGQAELTPAMKYPGVLKLNGTVTVAFSPSFYEGVAVWGAGTDGLVLTVVPLHREGVTWAGDDQARRPSPWTVNFENVTLLPLGCVAGDTTELEAERWLRRSRVLRAAIVAGARPPGLGASRAAELLFTTLEDFADPGSPAGADSVAVDEAYRRVFGA